MTPRMMKSIDAHARVQADQDQWIKELVKNTDLLRMRIESLRERVKKIEEAVAPKEPT